MRRRRTSARMTWLCQWHQLGMFKFHSSSATFNNFFHFFYLCVFRTDTKWTGVERSDMLKAAMVKGGKNLIKVSTSGLGNLFLAADRMDGPLLKHCLEGRGCWCLKWEQRTGFNYDPSVSAETNVSDRRETYCCLSLGGARWLWRVGNTFKITSGQRQCSWVCFNCISS